jgi:hypothetical protein
MSRDVEAAARGAAAGALATLPMTGVMLAAGKIGLMGQQPPKTIFRSMLASVSLPIPDRQTEKPMVAIAHIGYGMLAGALFGLLRSRTRLPMPQAAAGIGYGLLIWALSYKGWVPALHLMPSPEHDRPGRPEAMIAAHVVYGAALGALAPADRRGGRSFTPEEQR